MHGEPVLCLELPHLFRIKAPAQINELMATLTVKPVVVALALLGGVIAFGPMVAAVQDK